MIKHRKDPSLLFIPLILALQFNALKAQLSFNANGQHLGGLAGRGVVLADFNDDHNLDAFVVNENGPEGKEYRVYFGDGHGFFRDSISLLNPIPWASQPVAGDFDGDGKIEVITGWTVWICDGHGHFKADTTRFISPHDATLNQIAVGDLNGDGRPDLSATVYGNGVNGERVFLNDGKGRFVETDQTCGQGEGIQYPVVLGDLNGDGFIDAVTTGWRNKKSDPCPNRILMNDGTGHFAESTQILDEGMNHSHGLALADVDNDGDLDIIVGMQGPPFARVYLNNGHGHFTPGQTLGSRFVEKVFAADLNGDGAVDLFLACNGPNEVWVNDGHGHFTDSGVRLGTEWSWNAALGDLNGDRKIDAFVVNFAAEVQKGVYSPRGRLFEVWLNTSMK